MKNIIQALKVIALALVLSFGISYVYAWTAPTVTPPGGNVSAPINTSATAQYKDGSFGVGGLIRGYSNAVFDGNVGIGTTAPGAKLDVNGIIKATGLQITDGADSGKLLTSDASGNATWQTGATLSSATISGTATIANLAGNLQVTATAAEGAACTGEGRIAASTTASGLILSCQSGVWKSSGGSGMPSCASATIIGGSCYSTTGKVLVYVGADAVGPLIIASSTSVEGTGPMSPVGPPYNSMSYSDGEANTANYYSSFGDSQSSSLCFNKGAGWFHPAILSLVAVMTNNANYKKFSNLGDQWYWSSTTVAGPNVLVLRSNAGGVYDAMPPSTPYTILCMRRD